MQNSLLTILQTLILISSQCLSSETRKYSAKDIADRQNQIIATSSDRLKEMYKSTGERQLQLQKLISDQISKAKLEALSKISNHNKIIQDIKTEGNILHVAFQTCIHEQIIKTAKLYSVGFFNCFSPNDLSVLTSIRGKFLKLETVSSGISVYCQLLNPLESEEANLAMCISNKIKDIDLEVTGILRRFEAEIDYVAHNSSKCINEQMMDLDRELEEILGNVKKCKVSQMSA